MSVVDLRSDTVTQPTPQMREAIARAEVGDDVLGDDPTVIRLQEELAARFGREAALFVPSGSMANQIALLCYTRPGDHVITPTGAHVVHYEAGGGGAIAGVQFCELGERGVYDLDALEAHIQPDDHHHPPTALVTVEDTHNRAGGAVVPKAHLEALRARTAARGLPLHMDGARLFNALVATGEAPEVIGGLVDSLSVCFSKGLGAPIGSALIGDRAFIHRAHRYRKMLGGAMRQAGILAAAARYALAYNVDRLAEDHRRARALAEGLAGIEGVRVDVGAVETNIVYFDALEVDGAAFVARCAEAGVRCYATGPRRIRLVTHMEIDDAGVARALEVMRAAAT